ncbi:MAG: ferritin, partial [Cellulomonadaceae bacterium]
MTMNERLAAAFADQITLELQASIVYLQLGIVLEDADLPGMAGWMRLQSDEERVHAAKFIDHATDRGERPQIGAISAPTYAGITVLDAFEASLAHERKVSESIRDLYRLAQETGDIDCVPLLHWFIEEQ